MWEFIAEHIVTILWALFALSISYYIHSVISQFTYTLLLFEQEDIIFRAKNESHEERIQKNYEATLTCDLNIEGLQKLINDLQDRVAILESNRERRFIHPKREGE
jgi:hypothetical protein